MVVTDLVLVGQVGPADSATRLVLLDTTDPTVLTDVIVKTGQFATVSTEAVLVSQDGLALDVMLHVRETGRLISLNACSTLGLLN